MRLSNDQLLGLRLEALRLVQGDFLKAQQVLDWLISASPDDVAKAEAQAVVDAQSIVIAG